MSKVQQFVGWSWSRSTTFLGHLQQDIFIHMEINKRPERIKSDLYRLKEYAAIDSQNGRNGSIGLTLASNIVDRKQHVISIYQKNRWYLVLFYLHRMVCTGMHWYMSVAYFNIVNFAVYADRVRPRPRLCRHFLQASIQAGNRFDFGGYVNSGTF